MRKVMFLILVLILSVGSVAHAQDTEMCQFVAYIDGYDINIMDMDGNVGRLVMSNTVHSSLTSSHDYTQIAWIGGSTTSSRTEIYVLNSDNNFSTTISPNVPKTGQLAWSVDDTQIAYTGGGQPSQVYVWDLVSGTETLVTDTLIDYTVIGWTHDGNIVVTYGSVTRTSYYDTTEVLDETGTVLAQYAGLKALDTQMSENETTVMALSDGTIVLFDLYTQLETQTISAGFVALDGRFSSSNATVLTLQETNVSDPAIYAWTPNGEVGYNLFNVSNSGNYASPVLSPDGMYVAYISDGNTVNVTTSPIYTENPLNIAGTEVDWIWRSCTTRMMVTPSS